MKRFLPIGITADERVCSGAHYAAFFSVRCRICSIIRKNWRSRRNPSALTKKCEYHVPKVGEQPAKKQKKQQKATVQA